MAAVYNSGIDVCQVLTKRRQKYVKPGDFIMDWSSLSEIGTAPDTEKATHANSVMVKLKLWKSSVNQKNEKRKA